MSADGDHGAEFDLDIEIEDDHEFDPPESPVPAGFSVLRIEPILPPPMPGPGALFPIWPNASDLEALDEDDEEIDPQVLLLELDRVTAERDVALEILGRATERGELADENPNDDLAEMRVRGALEAARSATSELKGATQLLGAQLRDALEAAQQASDELTRLKRIVSLARESIEQGFCSTALFLLEGEGES